MFKIETLDSVTLGVTDLDAAIDFYHRVVRLELIERRPGVAFMSGGTQHHWIRLEESSRNGLIRQTFKVRDEAILASIRDDLKAREIEVTEGGSFGEDRVGRWLRFLDPAGAEVELVPAVATQAVPQMPRGIGLNKLLHTLWAVENFDETTAFYRDVFGFKESDRIEDVVSFLRCEDGYHHSLGFARSPLGTAFNHFCVLVDHIDDVMRYRHNAAGLGVKIEQDLLRHPTSGSMGVYLREPFSGFNVEFCTGHRRISPEEEATYVPRQVPFSAGSNDVWKQPLPEPIVETAVRFEDVIALAGDQPFQELPTLTAQQLTAGSTVAASTSS